MLVLMLRSSRGFQLAWNDAKMKDLRTVHTYVICTRSDLMVLVGLLRRIGRRMGVENLHNFALRMLIMHACSLRSARSRGIS